MSLERNFPIPSHGDVITDSLTPLHNGGFLPHTLRKKRQKRRHAVKNPPWLKEKPTIRYMQYMSESHYGHFFMTFCRSSFLDVGDPYRAFEHLRFHKQIDNFGRPLSRVAFEMQQLDKRIRNWILKENCGECLGMPQLEKFKTSIRNPKSEKTSENSHRFSLHALFHPFLLTYDTTQWIANGGLQDSLYKEILTFCWDCKWVPRFLLEDLQAGHFMKKHAMELIHCFAPLIHSFRSKWSNNPRSYPTIFRSKFLDSTHEIFRIKTGWLWPTKISLINNYFLWLQAGRRTVRRWKRNPNRLVLRFSRNSTRPAGLRTCQGVCWAQWVEPWRYGRKPLEMTNGTAGWFGGSLFGKLLAILKDAPQFLEDLEIG